MQMRNEDRRVRNIYRSHPEGKIGRQIHFYLKESAALAEDSAEAMDQRKLLLRITTWRAEHRSEGSTEDLWKTVSEGFGQERFGELMAGMNGTLITYAPDHDDEISITELGRKIVFDTIREVYHNCPL